MGVSTETTVSEGSYESITGYRSSGTGKVPANAENTCDILVTSYDPFDFSIDWRIKYVKVREKRRTKRGRYYFKRVSYPVPYPYYEFVKKTRSVKEWRLELLAGSKVLQTAKADGHSIPKVIEMYNRLVKYLARYGPCKPIKHRSPDEQHEVAHIKWAIDSKPASETLVGNITSIIPLSRFAYKYGAFDPPVISGQVGTLGDGYAYGTENFVYAMSDGAFTRPLAAIFNEEVIATTTAMLWPDSGDMEDIGSSPLIDLAEAASDSHFPLGPPPDPVDAHKRMVANAMDDKTFSALAEAIDFGANAHLWTTLVLEPIIQSAIGLAASVEANDQAIEAFTRKAKSRKWISGKSLRLFGSDANAAAECHTAPREWVSKTLTGTTDDPIGESVFTHDVDYKKFECNANFVYLLDEFDAARMNTSGVRIGQFLARMSSSLDEVLYNIIPLSFVFDWFSTEFSGTLNLKNKIYLPVDQWKLTLSYSLHYSLACKCNTYLHETWSREEEYVWISGWPWRQDWVPTGSYAWLSGTVDVRDVGPTTRWVGINTVELNSNESSYEEGKYYLRHVYDNPVRQTDFSGPFMDCFKTLKDDPLEDTGKQITLGALLWGFSR